MAETKRNRIFVRFAQIFCADRGPCPAWQSAAPMIFGAFRVVGERRGGSQLRV